MLITFKSKAAPDVMMYKDHAKPILDLLHKDPDRGVITAAEAPQAVAILEKEIAESRKREAAAEAQRDTNADRGDADDDTAQGRREGVSFATRAYPLLEMLRAARDGGHDVVWGV
jgi:hypothetical protein